MSRVRVKEESVSEVNPLQHPEVIYLFVGEIVNMPGHGFFVRQYAPPSLAKKLKDTPVLHVGLHIEDYRELAPGEG